MFKYIILFGAVFELTSSEYATKEAALTSLKIEMRRFFDEPQMIGRIENWSEGHHLRVFLRHGEFVEREWANIPNR